MFSSPDLSLIAVFFLGLSLNLTPCVYPMISITVSLFAHPSLASPAAGGDRWRAFLHACIYVLGICLMYSALGAFAAATGKIFGAWLQSPWVLAGVGFFLLIPALSMFDLFHFHVPGLPQHLPGNVFLRYFVSGVIAGLVAAPCVGPPVIALLANTAIQNNPGQAFLTFFVLSLGLGLPYLIFGTFSGHIKHLPKSGAWLIWVKQALGFILLGWAFFYFALAFKPALLQWVIPVDMLIAGVYLGFLERGNHKRPFEIFKKICGVILIAAAILLIFRPVQDGVIWEKYDAAIVKEIRQSGKPVIFDFYADWCIPCHELDQTTYRDPRVIKILENFRRIKVDLTKEDDELSANAIDEYEVQGVPTILFLDPQGKEITKMRTAGYISADELLLLLEAYHKEWGGF